MEQDKKIYLGKKELDVEFFWKKTNYCPIKWFNYKSMHSTMKIKVLYLFGLPIYRNSFIDLDNPLVIDFLKQL